jgi:hypothetical protein
MMVNIIENAQIQVRETRGKILYRFDRSHEVAASMNAEHLRSANHRL